MTERDELAKWAGEQTCPSCGTPGMRIEWRLVTKPLGTWSLAGAQFKVPATEAPFIICDGCGVESQGKRNPLLN